MTTQSIELMVLLKWTFLDPRDEVKRSYKARHEERTQRNAELDEFCRKQEHRKNRCLKHRCIWWLSEDPTPWHSASLSVLQRSCEDQVKHRLNRRSKKGHRCNRCVVFQRRCKLRRIQAFSTSWTGDASGIASEQWRQQKRRRPTASWVLWVTGLTDG